MVKNIFIATTFFVLAACDAYDDMSSMFEKKQLVQEYIKNTKGYETQVGFNISNGVLVQVTVYFQSEDVKQISVEELEKLALVAVAQSFKLTPKTLNVATQSNPDEKTYKDLQRLAPSNRTRPESNTR